MPAPHRDKSRSYKTTTRERVFFSPKGALFTSSAVHGGAGLASSQYGNVHYDEGVSSSTFLRR